MTLGVYIHFLLSSLLISPPSHQSTSMINKSMKTLYPISLQQILQRFFETSNSNVLILDDLIQTNDDIELFFSNTSNENEGQQQHQQPNRQYEISAQFIKELSCQLYSILVQSLSKLDIFSSSFANEDFVVDSIDEEKAHDLALSISKTIEAAHFKNNDKERRNQCCDDYWNEKRIQEIKLISQWIRTCKNLIRWKRIYYMKTRRESNTHNAQLTDKSTEQIQWAVATERLCSVGMVSLYLQLLNFFIYYKNDVSNHAMGTFLTLDDLARQSATILFYATFGQAPEPCCQKALRGFVSSLDGIGVIAKLLVTPRDCQCSVTTMLWLIKLVHNLVSSVSHALADFERAFRQISGHEMQYPVNLYSILVSTLGWSLNSESQALAFCFCGPQDKRPDLVVEIIRVLFAKQSVGKHSSSNMKDEKDERMTNHLRRMVVQILQLPNKNRRFYECKLASLLLLMNDAYNYAAILVKHHVVDQLLTILWLQLNDLLIEHAGEVHSERNATIVLPILIVLNQLVSCNQIIWEKVKEYIFPSSDEIVFLQKVEMYQKEVEVASESKIQDETKKDDKKNMHPIDAPVGTTRWKLIKLMTFAESNVKRCASELLWKICREDPGEFVLRCGFGNAVHMLGIKGLYSIPNS